MKVHNVVQGSVDWLLLRSGIPTASEFKALVTPLFKVKTGEGPQTYLHKKLAEWWMGGPISTFYSGGGLEQGSILEDEAFPWLEAYTGEKINRVGFITNDAGTLGCSPDGMYGTEGGVEIKSPEVHTHVGYLLDGVLPEEYGPQVHGGMYVTGAKWWRFFSYRRGLPPFILKIDRDDRIQDAIEAALDRFLEVFEDGKNALTVINGGPPKRTLSYHPKPKPEPRGAFVSEFPS